MAMMGEFEVGPSFVDYFPAKKGGPLPGDLQKWKNLYKSSDLFILAKCSAEQMVEIGRTDIALVIDGSGSMGDADGRWEWVRDSLLGPQGLCAQLQPEDQVGLVIFSDELRHKSDAMLSKNAAIESITRKFYELRPDGGTRTEVGLEEGLKLLKEKGRRDAVQRVIFLSDGENYPDKAQSDASSLVIGNQCASSEIDFFTVGFGAQYNELFMETLSKTVGSNAKNIRVQSHGAALAAFGDAFIDVKNVVAKNPSILVRNRNEEYFEWVGYRMTFPVDRTDSKGEVGKDWNVPLGGLTDTTYVVLFHLRVREDLLPSVQVETVMPLAEFEFMGQALQVTLRIHPATEEPRAKHIWPGSPQKKVFRQAVFSQIPNIRAELGQGNNLHPERRQYLVALGKDILQERYPDEQSRNDPKFQDFFEFLQKMSEGKTITLDELNKVTVSTRGTSNRDRDLATDSIDTAQKVKIQTPGAEKIFSNAERIPTGARGGLKRRNVRRV
jgi:hypothetical protein